MNKAILMGRLTKDPEIRYTATNLAVCRFTIAINRRYSKPGEEKQADFIQILVWDKLAEFCGKYFQKGRQVSIVGRIQVSNWEDNEGKKRYTTEVVAEEAYFADSKKDESTLPKFGNNFSETNQSDTDQQDGFYPLESNDDDLPF